MKDLIQYCAADTLIVLFWDKPETARGTVSYRVVREDGTEQCVTHSHCTWKDLTPDTAYSFRVYLGQEQIYTIEARTREARKQLDVTTCGAMGDGKTLNTQALQQAIDTCDAQTTLYFPAGTYLTGALDLHSHMDILLEEGAVLQGTSDPADYLPKIPSRFEGYERLCYRSLLNLGQMDHTKGPVCEDVTIRGAGTIYGGGKLLREATEAVETEAIRDELAALGDRICEYERPETLANRARGRLINISNATHVWIHGLTLGYGASWNVHFIYSDHIVTDACTFRSEGVWNGDGWDPDSSEDCTIFGCTFYTEDDSVAIKSGKNPEGNRIGRPTRHIRIFDCTTPFGHGLCIGSEMSGGIEGIRIWDCEMGPTWSGIEVKATKKRGGYVRDVVVRDCTTSHLMVHSVGYNDDGEAAPEPPSLSDMRFERIRLLGRFLDNNAGRNEWHDCPPIEVKGYDVPGYEVRNIAFSEILIPHEAMDNELQYCENVTIQSKRT